MASNVKIMQNIIEYILNQEVNIVKKDDKGGNSDVLELYKRLYKISGVDFYSSIKQYEEFSDLKIKFNKTNVNQSKKINASWSGQIVVKTLIQSIKLDVKSSDTILSIKNKVRDKEEVAVNLQRAFYKEKQLDDEKTLADCNILKGSTVNIILRSSPSIFIYVRTIIGSKFRLEVESSDTIASVKQIIQAREGLPAVNQRLIYNGNSLRDSQTLGYYNIHESSILSLVLKLRDGNQLYAKIPSGKIILLELNLNEQIKSAKTLIDVKESIPVSNQILSFAGKELDDDRKTFSELNIQKNDILEVNLITKEKLIYFENELLDPLYDFDFTNLNDDGKTFRRGGRNYERPCGWKRIAFHVKNKYDNEVWLGCNDCIGEWPVVYHGCNIDNLRTIGYDGFDLPKLKRLANNKIHFVTPKIENAVPFANEIVIDGQQIKFLLKSRVNPEKIIERKDGLVWLIASPDAIRPYGIIYTVVKPSK